MLVKVDRSATKVEVANVPAESTNLCNAITVAVASLKPNLFFTGRCNRLIII